jgi:hypothetical protein
MVIRDTTAASTGCTSGTVATFTFDRPPNHGDSRTPNAFGRISCAFPPAAVAIYTPEPHSRRQSRSTKQRLTSPYGNPTFLISIVATFLRIIFVFTPSDTSYRRFCEQFWRRKFSHCKHYEVNNYMHVFCLSSGISPHLFLQSHSQLVEQIYRPPLIRAAAMYR